MANCFRNVVSTCSPSPERISPVSTKTAVSWSPTALWTRAAATAESTPPERAHSTRPEPTCARTASTCDAITEACVHDGRHPQTSNRNRLSRSWPRSVCTTSGWNWTPYRARAGSSNAATATAAVAAVTVKPSGAVTIESPWLIHTCVEGSQRSISTEPDRASNAVRPNSPVPVRATCPPSSWARS